MKRTHLIKKISYSMLATSLVLGLSPATFAVAETASSATKTVIAADASDVVATDGTFTFADSGVTASADANSSNYEVSTNENGAQVLAIKEAGTYEITGSCSNGYVEVKKGLDGVTLILNDLTLSSSGEKTIKFKAGSTGTIVLKGTNTLSSSDDKGIIKANAAEDGDGDIIYASDGTTTGGDLTITGSGTLNLKSSYSATVDGETVGCDAINCEGDLTVLGGTFNIGVTDDGMHADNTLTIGTKGAESGPTINITSCEEGLEGATVNLYSGSADIVSSDDGINAANKDLTSYNWQYAINIAGGEWNVVAGGDGIDSNGNLTVSGGATIAYCTGSGNGALDIGEGSEGEIRGTFSYTGGTLLAVGSDMMVTPNSGTYVLFGGQGAMGGGMGAPGQQGGNANAQAGSSSNVVTKDSTVTISNGSKKLLSTTALASGSYAIFMSGDVASGTSYTLTNGSSTITATATSGSTSGQQGGPGNQQSGGFQPGGQQGGFRPGQGGPGGQQGNGQQGPGDGQTPPEAPADGQTPPDASADGQQPGGDQRAADDSNANENGSGASADTSGSEQADGADSSSSSESAGSTTEEDASTVKTGSTVTAGSGTSKATYKVVKLATATKTGTVTYTKSKSSSKTAATVPASVKINGKTYTVTGIAAKAFKGTKVKTVTVKSAKLTKSSVKNSLAGSKVTTVKVKVAGKKKANKAYVSKYAKVFKKGNSGKKVTVK